MHRGTECCAYSKAILATPSLAMLTVTPDCFASRNFSGTAANFLGFVWVATAGVLPA